MKDFMESLSFVLLVLVALLLAFLLGGEHSVFDVARERVVVLWTDAGCR